jgi:hypothetical protein
MNPVWKLISKAVKRLKTLLTENGGFLPANELQRDEHRITSAGIRRLQAVRIAHAPGFPGLK